jgi:hypothetical protein
VANDSGLLPMLVLVLLIALHIPYLIKSVRFTSSVDALVFSVLLISSVVGAALEPLLIASPTHFSWLLLLLGWSMNIGSRFRRTLPREVTIHEDKGVSPNG